MEFYKKNPEIPGTIFVQGEAVGDGTIVAGDEFKPFSDPSTFPGSPPKLVKVEFGDLNRSQVEKVQQLLGKQARRPQKHLGVIKSSQFSMLDDGNLKMNKDPVLTKKVPEPEGAKAPEKAKLVEGLGRDGGEERDGYKPGETEQAVPLVDNFIPQMSPFAEKPLRDVYNEADLIKILPGVTTKNASRVLDGFMNLDALANASNSSLKKVGLQASFFRRVREAARDLVGGGE